MFLENLNNIFVYLNITTASVARAAKCDPSALSRLRTGTRTPKFDSPSVKKVVDGIYSYCEKFELLESLCNLCNTNSCLDEHKIKADIKKWLFKDNSDSYDSKTVLGENKPIPPYFVNDKLKKIMEMLEISNVQMAKALNIDASYISRFKNSVRLLKSDTKLSDSICEYLLKNTVSQNKMDDLAHLINIDNFSDKSLNCQSKCLKHWLCHADDNDEKCINHLLKVIDAYSPNAAIPLLNPESIKGTAEPRDNSDIYYNTLGLQNAVIRFLHNAIKTKQKELWLYSDEEMSWIINDEKYRLKWFSLMTYCVQGGTKIKIIHNINRNLLEMISAIESWLPLYMSGMIEPYFCSKKIVKRFSRTIFLAPSSACIEGCNVSQNNEIGMYHYYTDSIHLNFFKNQYKALLSDCESLIRIHNQIDSEIITNNENICKSTDTEIPKTEFSNIKLKTTENTVTVTKCNPPKISFSLSHPLIKRAFDKYIEHLKLPSINISGL